MSDAHEMRFIGADDERIRRWKIFSQMGRTPTMFDIFNKKKILFHEGVVLPQMIIHDYLLEHPKVVMVVKNQENFDYWIKLGVSKQQLKFLSEITQGSSYTKYMEGDELKLSEKRRKAFLEGDWDNLPDEEITKEEESKQ